MDKRNHDITNKLYMLLCDIKGFDVAMTNPKFGKIIARFKGVNFIITITPIFDDTPECRKEENKPFNQMVIEILEDIKKECKS